MPVQPTIIQKLYNGEVLIKFYEGQHKYTLNDSSDWLISVTAVTGLIDKSRILIFWAINLAKTFLCSLLDAGEALNRDHIEEASKLHTVKKKEAADTGTQIHAWIEQYIKTKPSKRPNLALPEDEKVLNGVTAFLRWIKDYKVKFVASEKLVYSRQFGYVGLLDLKATIDGKLAIVDFKSSKAIYNEHFYQVAGYWGAEIEETGEQISEAWIVKFGKDDGEFEAYKISEDDLREDYISFLGLLAAKKREKVRDKNKPLPEVKL